MHKIFSRKWEKLGKIIGKDNNVPWIYSHTGSPCVTKKLEIYFTARDKNNISRIGKGKLRLGPTPLVKDITQSPILNLGDQGSFDCNGTSYPAVVDDFLYYTGWFPGTNTPFVNNLGLAKLENNIATRISRAPILPLTNSEPFGTGSACVIKESSQKKWHMWYTCFTKWTDAKHFYHIRYATSNDGVNWQRNNKVCIDFNEDEFAICKPSVILYNGIYHMVFCHRGSRYKLGYAYSTDKINWTRDDSLLLINGSKDKFDSEEMCYPFWFIRDNFIYLLYCGNNYGDEGIGIARLKL